MKRGFPRQVTIPIAVAMMRLCAMLLTLMDAISQGYAIGPIHASHWESRFHLPQPLGSALLPKSLQGRFPCENSEGPCAHEKVVWTGRFSIAEGSCWKYGESVMHLDIILLVVLTALAVWTEV